MQMGLLKSPWPRFFFCIAATLTNSASRCQSFSPSNRRSFLSSTQTILFCQLLGMNCAVESEFSLAWPEFCERGGVSDIHKDGWGLAYYVGKNSQGLRQFHDLEAASTSPLAKFLGTQSIRTRNLLAHIRFATSGAVDLANVHPFSREMWALNWCFCHNGHVPLFEDDPEYVLGGINGERYYNPIGDTDSEKMFCALLNALRAQFPETMPSLPVLHQRILCLCEEVVSYDRTGTILNFLLSCGPHILWVYSWPGQRPNSDVWNGVHYLVQASSAGTKLSDEDISVRVKSPGNDTICIVATKPLTNHDDWVELKAGELIVLDNGIPHITAQDLFRVDLGGHGLGSNSKVLQPPRLEQDMRRFHFNPEFFTGGGI